MVAVNREGPRQEQILFLRLRHLFTEFTIFKAFDALFLALNIFLTSLGIRFFDLNFEPSVFIDFLSDNFSLNTS